MRLLWSTRTIPLANQNNSPGQPKSPCVHSLQLLYTAGGNQAKSDPRTKFEILEPSPKGGVKLVVHIAVTGVQLGVVTEKLNVVTDGGRRKLSVVTDGAPAKGRRYHTSTHTERALIAIVYF